MFEYLSQKFSSIFSSLSQQRSLDDATVTKTLDQVKEALLSADVPQQLVKDFLEKIRTQVVGTRPDKKLSASEYLLRVVHQALLDFLGGPDTVPFTPRVPSTIMVMGLQGSGKTTTIAKLAYRFMTDLEKKHNNKKRILVASVDFYRPAAIDQLAYLANQAGVTCYRAHAQNPVEAAQEIAHYFLKEKYDLLLLDTAGRLHIDNQMLTELQRIDTLLQPAQKFLVLDAMTGQESLAVAKAFDQAIGFHAAILSKVDSDNQGGAAFAFRYALQKPISFVGIGEKLEDLDCFYPDRVADRMLGMGDIKTLIERAEQKIQKEEQERVAASFEQGRMTLNDFAQQIDMVNRMGSLSSLMKYIPGVGGKVSSDMIEQGQQEMKRFRAIIGSMTRKERLYPQILNSSRRSRVARGAGVVVAEVDKLLSRFDQMQQYAKLIKRSGGFRQLFK